MRPISISLILFLFVACLFFFTSLTYFFLLEITERSLTSFSFSSFLLLRSYIYVDSYWDPCFFSVQLFELNQSPIALLRLQKSFWCFQWLWSPKRTEWAAAELLITAHAPPDRVDQIRQKNIAILQLKIRSLQLSWTYINWVEIDVKKISN